MSIDDLAEIMKKIGKSINQGEMQDLKGEINPNENGMFDLKEYLSIMQRRKKDKDCDEDLLLIFKIIDKDENDLIGPDELLNFMNSLEHKVSQEETEEMIKEFDSDGDGDCTFKEFVKKIIYENEMIDLKEYLSIIQRRKKDKDCDEDLLVIFKIIDKSENDLIGLNELLNFMNSL